MKTLVVIVDGMRPDAFLKCGNPFAEKLMQISSYTLDAKTVFPSVTLPCHMSLFHSVDPTRHGTVTNTYTPQVRPIKGLVETLAAQKKKCAFFFTWEQLRDLSRPGKLDVCEMLACSTHKDSNELITSRAIPYIRDENPDFVFLYLADTDNTGHDHGWLSPEYMQDAHDAVACVEQVYEKFSKDYTIIFLADHGGHDRTHGTEMPEDITIPLFFCGPRFEAGKVLPEASIKDVATTIVKLMDIEPQPEWEGVAHV